MQRHTSSYSGYPQLHTHTEGGVLVQLMRLLRFCVRTQDDQRYFAKNGASHLRELFINNDEHVRAKQVHGDMDNLEMLNLWWASCVGCEQAIMEYAADVNLLESIFSLWVLLGEPNIWWPLRCTSCVVTCALCG